MKLCAVDLFCGAGGATKGLQRAGFHVTGIDIKPQPRYCGDYFIQADALNPPIRLQDFDFIWASPPCQHASSAAESHRQRGKVYPDLIEPTRRLLASGRTKTIMENVPQAAIRADAVLDGTMFPGLKVIRRRHFESNFSIPLLLGFDASGYIARHGWSCVVGNGRKSGIPKEANAWHTVAAKRLAMGIDWMNGYELSQAIPPAYSEYIGRAALNAMQEATI